jgi:uncharacterized protein
MHAFDSRPPDPRVVGDAWRTMWHQRLSVTPMIEPWLSHQFEDDYWRHGSVGFDYGSITVPVMAVGGWADPYRNAVLDLEANLSGPFVGIIGPAAHGYPHTTAPGPTWDFLGECAVFFDRHLRDGGDATTTPRLRVFVQDFSSALDADRTVRQGQWMASPLPSSETDALVLIAPGGVIASDERCGTQAGAWCPYSEQVLPGDQLHDDALSMCIDSDPLTAEVTTVGCATLSLRLASDQPFGTVVARLCDVAPDGTSCLVTQGALNLNRRVSMAAHSELIANEPVDIVLRLNGAAHRFAPGHLIRLALSPTYWPWVWPAPAALTLTVHGGSLGLPTLAATATLTEMRPATNGPLVDVVSLGGRSEHRPDVLGGRMRVGELEFEEGGESHYAIEPGDPLSARVHITRTVALQRDHWDTTVTVDATMTCTATHFVVDTTTTAWELDRQVHRSHHHIEQPRLDR